MRLAQDEVKVNVIGDDKVGVFKTTTAAAYILYHEQDAAKLVQNTKLAQRYAKVIRLARGREPEMIKKIEAFLDAQEKKEE